MRRLLALLALWLVMALTAPLALSQDAGQEPVGEEGVSDAAGAIAVEPVARDDQIERRVRQILDASRWYRDLAVEVEDGIVFIDGEVATDDRKTWAGNVARNTQDVVAVVNRLEVEPEVSWSFGPALDELRVLALKALTTLPLILLAIVILPLAWYAGKGASRLVRWALRGRVESPFLRDIIARAVAGLVLLLGIYVILQLAGLTRLAFSLLGGAGVLGIVIGFAFRDIAENFLASLLLSLRRPFRAGDFIEVTGEQGIVDSMNTRSTVLISVEGNHIQIPNAQVFKSTIVNYSAAPARRGTVEVGIGYDVSVSKAQDVIRDLLASHEAVLPDPEPLVLADGLGSSTVNLKVHYWFDGHRYSALKLRSALVRLIKKVLIEQGISMPDDAREIIFPQGVPVLELQEDAKEEARLLASADLAEAARAEAAEPESEEAATAAEGDLENERTELEQQSAIAGKVEGNTDLLDDVPGKEEGTGRAA